MPKVIYHLTSNIAGLMRNNTDKDLTQLFDMDGKKARKQLQKLKNKGHKLIPSAGCKHFDPVEGCTCRFHQQENDPT